ncbi:putative RNA polymerase II subunit B1 CTD phosphatase rpap2 [Cyprinodon tularosa]|uniref:putative RNA polymerase II subunit B1 CTD phosphatase rpap2 n=1 Tax=Cyprinodon tularosa TaxID=77115 RepID=UPI0018E1E5EF|nr:putative RNA polymerase II subunit B1 CTD phosphatase rpap2 [Cyprinodon tularosa]
MEADERRRRGGSAQSSKKGGKCVKIRTAEEEARRREEMKERLRERLEVERRALKVVERLLEDSVAEDFLVDCAKFITTANYKDTVEERFIAKFCGYPVCPNKLGKIPTQQYKISTKTNRVYDITERKCFCCNFCYKASKEYELQISKTPLWLRQHESPPEIKLLKKGDRGSSGVEVMLSGRRLREEDIEEPQAAPPPPVPAGGDFSDGEREFPSSDVSQQQRPRVHWADLPGGADGDGNRAEPPQIQNPEENGGLRGEQEGKEIPAEESAEAPPGDQSVDELTSKLSECVTSGNQRGETRAETVSAASCTGPEPSAGSRRAPCSTGDPSNPPGLSITQVGMSRRGAAGLQDLLRKHGGALDPESVRRSLLESLKRTLKDWCTEETLSFLYGADRPPAVPFTALRATEEEELDEDDLEDDDDDDDEAAEPRRPPGNHDYEKLREEAEQLQLRVREFYKGTWVLPEEEQLEARKISAPEAASKDPALPLIDSHAQNLIQKRITVERLSSCLRNIVGPVGLTMSDVSTDLNHLVRTFRFTNSNIIHKTPEWTLIAVVLLHLLSDVSPVVQEALKMSASVQYLNTLMEELGLREQDLLSLVQLFKPTTN